MGSHEAARIGCQSIARLSANKSVRLADLQDMNLKKLLFVKAFTFDMLSALRSEDLGTNFSRQQEPCRVAKDYLDYRLVHCKWETTRSGCAEGTEKYKCLFFLFFFQIAFQFLNPFPMQKIRTKRAYHLEVVKVWS